MKREMFVFVVISKGSIETPRGGIIGVGVSSSLKGISRSIGVSYDRLAKKWARRKEGKNQIEIGDWVMGRYSVDLIEGRGDREIGKKLTGGFRGYRGGNGLLVDAPKAEKKRTLADDSTVRVQAGSRDGVDAEYEFDCGTGPGQLTATPRANRRGEPVWRNEKNLPGRTAVLRHGD